MKGRRAHTRQWPVFKTGFLILDFELLRLLLDF